MFYWIFFLTVVFWLCFPVAAYAHKRFAARSGSWFRGWFRASGSASGLFPEPIPVPLPAPASSVVSTPRLMHIDQWGIERWSQYPYNSEMTECFYCGAFNCCKDCKPDKIACF